MNFEPGEKEIEKIFESYRMKQPPESLMKDFEAGVLKKIKAGPGVPVLGLGIAFSMALALAFLFAFVFFVKPRLAKEETPVVTPSPLLIPASPRESDWAPMTEDLFILEMLGEDEGLLNDFERLAVEAEVPASSSLTPRTP